MKVYYDIESFGPFLFNGCCLKWVLYAEQFDGFSAVNIETGKLYKGSRRPPSPYSSMFVLWNGHRWRLHL